MKIFFLKQNLHKKHFANSWIGYEINHACAEALDNDYKSCINQKVCLSSRGKDLFFRHLVKVVDDSFNEIVHISLSTNISSSVLAFLENFEKSLFNVFFMSSQSNSVQHLIYHINKKLLHNPNYHQTREQESSGVSQALASNIGSRTVDGFVDSDVFTDVTGRSQTETTNKT